MTIASLSLSLSQICTHSRIFSIDATNELVKFGINKPLLNTTIPMHLVHTTQFSICKYLQSPHHTHHAPQTQLYKEYTCQLTTTILPQYPYVAKWLNNPLIHAPHLQLLIFSTPPLICTNPQTRIRPIHGQSKKTHQLAHQISLPPLQPLPITTG